MLTNFTGTTFTTLMTTSKIITLKQSQKLFSFWYFRKNKPGSYCND